MAVKKKSVRRMTHKMRGNLSIVFFGILCLFLVLAARLCYWTIRKGDQFSTIVLGQQNHASSAIAYERGKIYDRSGNILAANEKIYTLVLEPKNILDTTFDEEDDQTTTYDGTVSALVKYFGLNEKDLRKTIEDHPDSYYEVYKEKIPYEEVDQFNQFMDKADISYDENTPAEEKTEILHARKVAGVRFEESYQRIYPYNSLACRALGFTSSGNQGNWGIEQYYNDTLNGTDGRNYYYFNEELAPEQTTKEAINGNSLVSTIDMQIQRVIEDKIQDFDKEVGSSVTSVLVMDPNNGEILGMASSNPYDLNDPMNEETLLKLFSQKEIDEMKAYTKKKEAEEEGEAARDASAQEDTSEEAEAPAEEEKKEEEDEDKKTIYDGFYELWRNNIISNTYEPGSTYKPFTVAAGLESGALKGDEKYYCVGSLAVSGRNIGCSHVHESVDLKNAVAQSCNVAMMNIAFNETADIFYRYQNLFGFGRKTGVDLPGEAKTSDLVYNANNYENSVTLATNAFGQNFNCSMIQMASAFSSLINGGHYYKPHIVKEIQSDNGDVVKKLEAELVRDTVSEETSETMKSYLKETVANGTGTKAQIPGYSIGGKTGTAEKIPRNKEDYYISFMGFAPVGHPEVLIYATIDEPNVDNQANAALAVNLERECMEEILPILGIQATEKITQKDLDAYEARTGKKWGGGKQAMP